MQHLLTIAGAALALQALSTTTAHADTVSQTAVQSEFEYWVNCANEANHCYPITDGLVTMRYGDDNNYTYIITEGLERISCNNFWGDPDKGTDKSCAYTVANPFAVAPNDTYVDIAKQGERFILPVDPHAPHKIHWVRYGSGDRWMYTVMAADGAESMACTNDRFSYNPAPDTKKVCQYSEGAYYTLSDFETLIECATQGQNCVPINASAVILMRYGVENKYDWRFVHQSSGSYPCNNDFFNPNPVHETKRCFWTTVAPAAIFTEGSWLKVGSCQGVGCPISETISVGTNRTNTWTTSADWSTTVTASIEEDFGVAGTGTKVTEEVATSFALSEGYQVALSTSLTESFTATCDPVGAANSRVLYQFRTETTETCLQSGECNGLTFTADYACISDPPAGYQGPQCVPGYCSTDDPLCQLPCAN